MKSTTQPKRRRSITLPIAPPPMAPSAIAASWVSARRPNRERGDHADRQAGEHEMAPLAEPGQQVEGHAAISHHGQVEHRGQHDRRAPRQVDRRQDRPFADLVGEQHQHGDEQPLADMAIPPMVSSREFTRAGLTRPAGRPVRTPPRRRSAQSAGCLGCWPTSCNTRQQRTHLVPGAASTFMPIAGLPAAVGTGTAAGSFGSAIDTPDTISVSAQSSAERGDCSPSGKTSVTQACSEDPIRPDRRASSRLAVTACRLRRISRQRNPSASPRQDAGSVGNSRRCTLSASPKRAPQASSAVKHSTGASQVVRQRCRWSSTVRAARRRGLSGRSQ